MKGKTVAQQECEHAGRSFMNTTLTLALDMRPKCDGAFISIQTAQLWLITAWIHISIQVIVWMMRFSRNDQLQWLWEKSTVLHTSIYLEKMRNSSSNALKFVHYRVREAMRIAEKARHDYVLPAFVFCSPFYLHSIEILSHVRNSTSTHKNVNLVKLLYSVYENGIFL